MVVLIAIYLSYTQLTGSTVLIDSPKLTVLAFGGEFLQAVLRMMVSSVVRQDFTPYRRTTFVSWSLLGLNGASLLLNSAPLINEFWLLLAICTMVWLATAHYVYYVLEDFKRVLGISIFSIEPKLAAETTTNTKKKRATRSNQEWKEDKRDIRKAKKRVD